MTIRSCSRVLLAIPCLVAACLPGVDPRPPTADTLGPTSSPGTTAAETETGPEDPSTSSASPTSTSPSPSTSATDGQGSTPADGSSTTVSDPTTGGASTGVPSSVCDGIEGESLMPPSACDGPGGNTSTEIPGNGLFSTSWFGCYFDDDGSIVQDPGDNCEFACGSQGLCPGQDGPTCEANLRWFAADADRYGCGGRIRVTNCENGHAVVLVTLDRGPNCSSVEMACDTPVLDMSHDAMDHLFEGAFYGGCEHQVVVVEVVEADTPLGPV
jgi:hypothetical protein